MDRWPGFDDQVYFELLVDRALLTLTADRDGFARGSSVWRAAWCAVDAGYPLHRPITNTRASQNVVRMDWSDDLVGMGWVVAQEPQLRVGGHVANSLDDEAFAIPRISRDDDVTDEERALRPIDQEPIAILQARLHRMAADGHSRETAAARDDRQAEK